MESDNGEDDNADTIRCLTAIYTYSFINIRHICINR